MRRPTLPTRTFAGLAASVLALAVLAGCSRGSKGKSASSTSAPTTTIDAGGSSTSTSTTSGTTETSLAGAGVTPVSTPVAGRALLSAVRAATNPGADRVVFEFEAEAPGYRVQYVERPVLEDGSGREIRVAGDAVLEIRMEHASGVDLGGQKFRETYTGPTRIPVGGPAVVETTQAGDFEGVLRWVIGVNGKQPFTVHVLSGPTRIVIDVQHPPPAA